MKTSSKSLQEYLQGILSPGILPSEENRLSNKFLAANYMLLCKSAGFSEKADLLITLRARRELPTLLYSVLQYAATQYKPKSVVHNEAVEGDLVYYESQVWKVKKIIRNTVLLSNFIDPKIEKTIPFGRVLKIEDTKFKYKRKTIDFAEKQLRLTGDLFLTFYEWFADLKVRYAGANSIIENENEESQGKVLIITPYSLEAQRLLTEFKKNPFRLFYNNTQQQTAACTSFEPIVDIYISYDLANNTKVINEEYDEIVVVGQKSCNKYISDLVRLRSRNRIRRFVLMTSEDIETNYPFIEWHWTKEEVNLLLDRSLNDGISLEVTESHESEGELNGVTELQALVNDMMTKLQQLAKECSSAKPEKVYYLINEYLRFILPPANTNSISKVYLERLESSTEEYLSSEEFKDAFYERGVYDQKIIRDHAQVLKEAFHRLNTFFYSKNPKYKHISVELKNSGVYKEHRVGRYIISPRSSITELRSFPEFHNETSMVGSVPLYDRELICFDRIVDDPNTNPESVQFVFPFIFNRSQYESMLDANGDIKLYLYDQLEDFKYVKILEAHERRFLQKIQHPDRRLFTTAEYIIPVEETECGAEPIEQVLLEEGEMSIKSLYKRYNSLGSEHQDFFEQLFAVDDYEYHREKRGNSAQDHQDYEITFSDGERFTLAGNKRIVCVERDEVNATNYYTLPLSGIEEGQEVIIYRNQSKELLYQILLEHDKSGLMKDIERASNLWFSTLREIARQMEQDYYDVIQLFRHKDVVLTEATLRGYLNKERKFPRETATLEAIRQIANDKGLSSYYLLASDQISNILKCKAQYQSLSVTLGREISDEVLHYHLKGQKGDLLQKLDSDIVEILKLNIKQGKVKLVEVKK